MPKTESSATFADGELSSRNEGTLRIDTPDGETEYLPAESVDSLYLHGQIDFNTRAPGLLTSITSLHVSGWKRLLSRFLPPQNAVRVSGNTVVEQVRTYDSPERRLQIGYNIIEAKASTICVLTSGTTMAGAGFCWGRRRTSNAEGVCPLTSDINELRSIGRKCAKDILIRALTRFYAIRSHPSKREYNPRQTRGDAAISFNGMVYTTQSLSDLENCT